MRFVLAGSGSRGDIQPLLLLASALREAGHSAVLVGPPNFERAASERALEFHAAGPDSEALLKTHSRAVVGGPLAQIRFIKTRAAEDVAAQFQVLANVAANADCIVSAGVFVAASSVAELYGCAYRFVAYFPEALPSPKHPPALFPRQGLPAWLNRLSWAGMRAALNFLLRGPLNVERKRAGLLPIQSVQEHVFDAQRSLLAYDAELVPHAPFTSPALGAWQPAQAENLPPDLSAFLDRGAPPVYLGFGSMPDATPEKTTASILEAAHRHGVRVVLSSGWAELGKGEIDERAFVVGPVSHAALLPRCALAVHHGGAGTTAAVARAGIPQVIVPHVFDQFGWAQRIHGLGLGPAPLNRRRFSAQGLAEAIRAVHEDAGMRERAKRLAGSLAKDGLARAVRALSDCCGSHPQLSHQNS